MHRPPPAQPHLLKKGSVRLFNTTEWRNPSSCSLSSHAIKFAASCGGSLPLFLADFFFFFFFNFGVHNLYIYLTCFCVRRPPAFFKGRVLRDFLSCSFALFRSRKLLLPFHKQEANAEALLMPPSWDKHLLSPQQRHHAPSRRRGQKACSSSYNPGADLCHCVSVCHTDTGPATSTMCLEGCRIFLSHPCEQKESSTSAPCGEHVKRPR